MAFTCFIMNNTSGMARAVVASVFNQVGFTIAPGGYAPVYLSPGTKTLSSFEFGTGNMINVFPIDVVGSNVFEIQPGGVAVTSLVQAASIPLPTAAAATPPPGFPHL